MNYQYIDEPWNRQTVRVIRIPNSKASNTGGFHGEFDSLSEPSISMTTYDTYFLKKLREQNEAEKRLAYFDVDGTGEYNSPGLEVFHAEYDADDYDGREWQSAAVKI